MESTPGVFGRDGYAGDDDAARRNIFIGDNKQVQKFDINDDADVYVTIASESVRMLASCSSSMSSEFGLDTYSLIFK